MIDERMYKDSAFYTYDIILKKSPLCEKYGKTTPNKYP